MEIVVTRGICSLARTRNCTFPSLDAPPFPRRIISLEILIVSPCLSILPRKLVISAFFDKREGETRAARILPYVISISCLRTHASDHIFPTRSVDQRGRCASASYALAPRCIFHGSGDVGNDGGLRPLDYPLLTDGRRRPTGLIGVGRVRASRFRGRANIL